MARTANRLRDSGLRCAHGPKVITSGGKYYRAGSHWQLADSESSGPVQLCQPGHLSDWHKALAPHPMQLFGGSYSLGASQPYIGIFNSPRSLEIVYYNLYFISLPT